MTIERLSVLLIAGIIIAFLISCNPDSDDPKIECSDSEFFCQFDTRNFNMGFTSWPYAATKEALDDTYKFLLREGDIYSEHIDSNIPWNSWINNLELPTAFIENINSKVSKKTIGSKLTVSVSLLNSARDDLAPDYDGLTPEYTSFSDSKIEEAYFKHLKYITEALAPDYLLIAIEVNEILNNSPEKWEQLKSLMTNIRTRIKEEFPDLLVSESITLHNLYQPDVENPENYIDKVVTYANTLDFVAISFYPFFKGISSKEGFQQAFDFLHSKINKPIAFAETGHLSEDLTVDRFNLYIPADESEQTEYLEVLMTNAQENDYEYLIWWTHRDYDELLETFPEEVKDLGMLWISTGIINEDGVEKQAFKTWQIALNKR